MSGDGDDDGESARVACDGSADKDALELLEDEALALALADGECDTDGDTHALGSLDCVTTTVLDAVGKALRVRNAV